MAEYLIKFQDVQGTIVGVGISGAVSGSVVVNYDTPTPTIVSSTLQAVDTTGVGVTIALDQVTITQLGSLYTIHAGASAFPGSHFNFSYTGQAPTSLTSASLIFFGTPQLIFLLPNHNILVPIPVCFLEGTLIRTTRGDLPVETLKVGDVVVTASGERRAVRWLGHRRVNCRTYPDPFGVFPVRIAQDAFGPNRPSQDLFLSSGHAVCVDLCGEVLIPVGNLINGSTIAQVEMDEVTYWHVELDSHDVLLANNLPAESYLAMTNRGFFEEAGATLDVLDEGRGRTYADFCRPVANEGPVLSFARQRLMERAEAIGWTPSRDSDLRLVVDGEVHYPVEDGDAAVFRFPASARDVRLLSGAFIPALVGHGGDTRKLGVSITGLSFSGDGGEPRNVSLNDERLKDGFHSGEGKDGVAWRWTKGEVILSPSFWDGLAAQVAVTIRLGSPSVRGWIAPVKADAQIPSGKVAPPQLHSVAR